MFNFEKPIEKFFRDELSIINSKLISNKYESFKMRDIIQNVQIRHTKIKIECDVLIAERVLPCSILRYITTRKREKAFINIDKTECIFHVAFLHFRYVCYSLMFFVSALFTFYQQLCASLYFCVANIQLKINWPIFWVEHHFDLFI